MCVSLGWLLLLLSYLRELLPARVELLARLFRCGRPKLAGELFRLANLRARVNNGAIIFQD